MPQNSLVLALAILAPEVDALLRTAFERLTRDKGLGIGERIDKIVEVVEMIGECVVAVEPREIRQFSCLVLPWTWY
jgi:hypothetical protein